MPTNTYGQDITKFGGSVIPTAPTPIAADTLSTPPAPLNVQAPAIAPLPTVVQSAAAPAPAPTTPPAPTSSLENLAAQLSGKTLDTAATKAAATLPYEQQLNQVNQQLATQFAKSIANQEAAAKMGETQGFATREQQNVARTDAIETLKLQAIQSGLQGNIALAEKQAQMAIDAKYGQIEKDIEAAKTNLYNNYDTFTEKEKKRAQATLLKLDKDDAFVQQQKADDALIASYATTALKFGADVATVQKMYAASSPQEAQAIGAKYMQDPKAKYELESARLDNILKLAQIEKTRKEADQVGKPTKEELKTAKEEKQARESEVAKAQQALSVIQQLKKGFNTTDMFGRPVKGGAGYNAVGPIQSKLPTLSAKTADFERAHRQLKALLSLDNYKLLKGTGQISNYEGQLLADAATQLDFNMSEKAYEAELDKLTEAFDAVLSRSSTLDDDEQAVLDTYFNTIGGTPALSPANYFR